MTDLHVRSSWREAFDRLLQEISVSRPDLILCTGDFIHEKVRQSPAMPFVYRMVEGLRAPLGCYAILGNHDTHAMEARLAGTRVKLINGQRHLIQVQGATLELIGLQGVKRKELTRAWVESMPPRSDQKSCRIVLSHYPDHIRRTKELHADVFLAGHTHGGQICFPGGYPPIRHDSLPRRLCTGVHRVGDTWLVVGRGLGAGTPPIRLFCPPEVIEIRLVRATENGSPD